MNGQKGLAIAITALLLTVCIGYLFNAEETTTTKLVYEKTADMDAIFYNDSSRVSGAEEYNPASNVTDWTPTLGIPTTTSPNQYIITQGSITYSADKTTTKTFSGSGLTYSLTPNLDSGTWYYSTNDNGVRYFGGLTYNNGEYIHGGMGQPNSGNLKHNIIFNGTSTDAGDYLLFADVKDFVSFNNKDYLYLTNGPDYYLNVEITSSGQLGNGGLTTTVTGSAVSEDHAYWNEITEKWDLYDSNDVKIGTADNIYIVEDSISDSFVIKYKTFTGATNSTYADPTKLVDLSGAQVAYWNKNTELYVTKLTMVMTIPNLQVDTWPNLYFNIGAQDNDGQNIGLSVFDSRYITNDGQLLIDDGTGHYSTFFMNDACVGLQITVDMVERNIIVEGITAFDSNAPRYNYTLSGVTVTRTIPDYCTAESIGQLSFRYSHYDPLTQRGSLNIQAAVTNTEILTDPSGVLWNDFNVDLSDYFYNDLVAHPGDGHRVQFGGFVSYGDTLTINNQTFTVTDGTINVPITDGLTTVYRDMRLNGLAVDYRDGNVYLVFTEGLNREVDLGGRVSFNISGTGAWYFAPTFNKITETTADAWAWSTDWSIDRNTTCLVFLGLTITGLVIGLYFGRGQFELYDWAVLILADIIALTLMVV